MNIKKKTWASFLSIVLFLQILIGPVIEGVENNAVQQPYYQILFVIDSSNSMNYQDKNKLVQETVKMFIDGSHSTKTDIGFVTYNDHILKTYPLTSMKESTARQDIKAEIDRIERYGNTDIGMAIDYGMDMLIKNKKQKSKPVMVLLSDGETDLTYSNTGRTYADSKINEKAAYEKAKELGCPIYSIGLSKDGTLNTSYLTEIAKTTGGKKYAIKDSFELLELFNTLFQDITRTPVVQEKVVKGTGNKQTFTLEVPYYYTNETNIFIQHNKPIKEVEVEQSSKDSILYHSQYYTGIKNLEPQAATLTVSFVATPGDEIKANAIHFIDILPQINIPENVAAVEVPIQVTLYDTSHNKTIIDPKFYKGLKGELSITDKLTEESSLIPMENTGIAFEGIYSNTKPKSCDFQVKITGLDYDEVSPVQVLTFTNAPPIQLKKKEITLLKQGREKEINLNSYFADPEGENLVYEQAEEVSQLLPVKIQNDTLFVIPQEEGTSTVDIKVTDGRGGSLQGNLVLHSVSFWTYYRKPILGIGGIFIALFLAYLIFSKRGKSVPAEPVIYTPAKSSTLFKGARFEGYFINTLSGKEVPVLYWNAGYIENRHSITLGDLLAMLDVDEKLKEAQKIYFEAGNNGTVLFSHDTECIISFGNRELPPRKKEVLNYEDKLYIMFEDHVTEVEIRYKRERKRGNS